MTSSVEIRRGDYTGAGVYRTSKSTTRANITGIKIKVDTIQDAITKNIISISLPKKPDGQKLKDLGSGMVVFTVLGTITTDPGDDIPGVYHMLDLRTALIDWSNDHGVMALVWTDEEDSSVTMTYYGMPSNGSINYTSGFLGVYGFTFQFTVQHT